jgi:hypothetical protein
LVCAQTNRAVEVVGELFIKLILSSSVKSVVKPKDVVLVTQMDSVDESNLIVEYCALENKIGMLRTRLYELYQVLRKLLVVAQVIKTTEFATELQAREFNDFGKELIHLISEFLDLYYIDELCRDFGFDSINFSISEIPEMNVGPKSGDPISKLKDALHIVTKLKSEIGQILKKVNASREDKALYAKIEKSLVKSCRIVFCTATLASKFVVRNLKI